MNFPWQGRIVAILFVLGVGGGCAAVPTVSETRSDTLLDSNWRSAVAPTNSNTYAGAEKLGYNDQAWKSVEVPHNWDDYGGEHRLLNGNLHGSAWYRREFTVDAAERGRRVFLFFEGVGSYATVWVNGQSAGQHAGGRTTFTLDVTDLVEFGGKNLLVVRADEPEGINDLPWVSGGDWTNTGFSEGSQPLGIFRPVHLVVTDPVRVEPFGVHVWNDSTATNNSAVVHVETEIRNYGSAPCALVLETQVRDHDGRVVADLRTEHTAAPGETFTLRQDTPELKNVSLWSPANPHLYTIETTLLDTGRTLDQVETPFGIRVIHWPTTTSSGTGQFLVNGNPVLINGTCEYEHLLGGSHAFSDEQIRAVVSEIEAAGFNAFRDAHQPHNLLFQEHWDHDGILWWPQFSAHIWFDNPVFRENFKSLLRDWVKERRNSPSLVLWGLQNESVLPEDFARECSDIIREMDPTASSQRLIVTCNGGKGTDWNVPQNWSGTYGGDPAKYADELKRDKLEGEYGAWRSLGLHTEGGYTKNGALSEDRLGALMEMKIRAAESVRDAICGQFQWVFATHDNPGRKIGKNGEQGSDGVGELNGVGPANNKGLLTLWGEPTDAYYLYRSNYVSAANDPMVMIVSHTWPDRWTGPGKKDGIIVYSNCDEVELFNDYQGQSLGRRTRNGRGTHFQWDGVEVRYNVLYAEGRVNGKVVATDAIVLNNLPEAPHRAELNGTDKNLTAPDAGLNYLYRVHCGGPEYTDKNGSRWLADHDYTPGDLWGSVSWAEEYDNVPARFGSQGETHDAIKGTGDDALFQTYRFGREKLRYRFAVPDGEYRIELYFAEPWYGRGGGNCGGWRQFDVAVNDSTVIRSLDLWKEAGYAGALKKVVAAQARNGWLEISFPRVEAGEVIISAIAIATSDTAAKIPNTAPVFSSSASTTQTTTTSPSPTTTGSNSGDIYVASKATLVSASLDNDHAMLATPNATMSWSVTAGLGGEHDLQVRYINNGATPVPVEIKVVAADGTVVDSKRWELAPNTAWASSGPAGGLSFNAGTYTITLTFLGPGTVQIESLSVK